MERRTEQNIKLTLDKKDIEKLERKVKKDEAEKERTLSSIESTFTLMRETLVKKKMELRENVEKEYEENPCKKVLEKIRSGSVPTDDEIRAALADESPYDHGTVEKQLRSFLTYFEEFMKEAVKSDAFPNGNQCIRTPTPGFGECCAWKECSCHVEEKRKYIRDEENPKIARKIGDGVYGDSTIVGNTFLPPQKVISWSIKILKSSSDDGRDIFIGVAPFSIDQNEDKNYDKCGWYFDCYCSGLFSGPPHYYTRSGYGLKKRWNGQYVHTGDKVGIIVDTEVGDVSFVLNGVNLGVAYERISLDKPLVPCAILKHNEDSVELDTSEVKENVDSSIPVPSNITTESERCDSITLTWDDVEGASFYQIEEDGRKSWKITTLRKIVSEKILPDTEHSFRVRAVRGNSVSEWSDIVKGRTRK